MRPEKEERRFRPPAVGGSSLLVIFAALCLTIFALLGLGTVQADERLSRTSAEAIQGYYAADCQAEEILARLRAGQQVKGVTVEDGMCVYNCPISDTQTLSVRVRLEEDGYTILHWKAVSTADWVPDDSLNLWDGGMDLWDGGDPAGGTDAVGDEGMEIIDLPDSAASSETEGTIIDLPGAGDPVTELGRSEAGSSLDEAGSSEMEGETFIDLPGTGDPVTELGR